MPVSSRTPELGICLWFDGTARAAAEFYVSLFPDSEITSLNLVRDGADGGESGKEIAFVGFTVAGRPFQALDGGPMFQHSEAVSIVVPCETQEEADAYWDALLADGGEASKCGWLKDRFGVSWQVVPNEIGGLLGDPDPARAAAAHAAMMQMSRLDVATMRAAADAAG